MSDEITEHYSFGGLRDRIEDGLAKVDEPITVELLGLVDEFHVGGRPATRHLVDALGLSDQDHVLDIGSGLGGTARYIASTTGASVTGIDLTVEYVQVARWLTGLVGLDDSLTFIAGTAASLPAEAGPFTAATMVHVGMNIADKQPVFDQVAAVLPPGGRFAIYDIMTTGTGDYEFPMPWAAGPVTSAVESADSYTSYLEHAGFSVESVSDRSAAGLAAFKQQAAAAVDGPPSLGLHLVMGPTTPTKIGNLIAAIRSGALAPTQIVGRVPK